MTQPQHILAAAARCIRRGGASGATLGAIAAEAQVSKGLLLYHFTDKSGLIVALLGEACVRILGREAELRARPEGTRAVAALRSWMEEELAREDVALLAALAFSDEPAVRAAVAAANEARVESARETVHWLFEQLGLAPRVPDAFIARATVALLDGLALRKGDEGSHAAVAFDVFWLGMLGLAE
ncbi:MAG: regulatory protein TetR [Gemmatimonadetes bacterium]|nr:regulatory protein TetR [Gemmatimonadota bacterium]